MELIDALEFNSIQDQSMLESRYHVFALQIEDSDRFIDIFGLVVSSIIWDDIVDGYKRIAQKILRRYKILSSVVAPFWGRCFLPFVLNQPSIPVDREEQISSLTAAARQLIREMLQNNLGMSTGTKLNFKIIITPMYSPQCPTYSFRVFPQSIPSGNVTPTAHVTMYTLRGTPNISKADATMKAR